ncbi:hypothetical protein [Streptomyces iconiensis]|uniref:DUF4352 domain-containing protein n=1 Tax=Streptomyces iconiensis TaxID=1384038 RepID=A0ABT6ZQ73_9ACTN|nr:hypothetical protein [Streptomyces iconiensis]MDJ1131210.1 hypothetical protein [Streptomyces iconiensis]
MEAEARSESEPESVEKTDRRWQVGCVAAILVLGALLLLGMWGLSELEKGLDGYGQLEGSAADSPDGSAADPLMPGMAARFEDGLTVSVGDLRRERGGHAYRFTVTYENETDRKLRPGGPTAEDSVSEYEDAPLVVRAGDPLDDTGSDDGSVSDWLNKDAAAARLLAPLGEGESVAVPVRVSGDTKGMPVTVEVKPPDDEYRDTAYWQLTLA